MHVPQMNHFAAQACWEAFSDHLLCNQLFLITEKNISWRGKKERILDAPITSIQIPLLILGQFSHMVHQLKVVTVKYINFKL